MKNKFVFVKGKLKRTLKKTLKIFLREGTIYEEERTSLGKIVNPKVMEGQWHKRNKDHEQKRKKKLPTYQNTWTPVAKMKELMVK